MLRRPTACVLLACYGVIALWGQGLHELLDDDGCCEQTGQAAPVVVAGPLLAWPTSQTEGRLVVESPSGGHVHDCDNCPICQFQALGQHFIAPPPTDIGLTACDILSPGHAESVYCPALFSPAQPRAPPVA